VATLQNQCFMEGMPRGQGKRADEKLGGCRKRNAVIVAWTYLVVFGRRDEPEKFCCAGRNVQKEKGESIVSLRGEVAVGRGTRAKSGGGKLLKRSRAAGF